MLRRYVAMLAALLLAGTLLGPASTAQAVELPGGKANYVVSFGSLLPEWGRNWVRLGTYRFSADGRVRSVGWVWHQNNPVSRVGTSTVPEGNCSGTETTPRQCEILTAGGFTSAANEVRTGDYTMYTGSDGRRFVNIDWDIDSWRTEEWYVDVAPDGTYSRLEFKYSQKFTHGYGYGSNAAFGERRPLETVVRHSAPLTMTYHRAVKGSVNYVDSPWNMSNWDLCTTTTWCMTWKIMQASSGTCVCGAPYDQDRSIQNYIQKLSNVDRRDTFWHWCTCLSKSRYCYQGNSHVYPLLQVIDDNGGWRGWVGVEAAFYPYSDIAEPRSADMLSVFRVAEWA